MNLICFVQVISAVCHDSLKNLKKTHADTHSYLIESGKIEPDDEIPQATSSRYYRARSEGLERKRKAEDNDKETTAKLLDTLRTENKKGKLEKEEEASKKMNSCMVCMEEDITPFAITPCGHTPICGDCVEQVVICPHCKVDKVGTLKLFNVHSLL